MKLTKVLAPETISAMMEKYANQRVIEFVEQMIEDGMFDYYTSLAIEERLTKLKQ